MATVSLVISGQNDSVVAGNTNGHFVDVAAVAPVPARSDRRRTMRFMVQILPVSRVSVCSPYTASTRSSGLCPHCSLCWVPRLLSSGWILSPYPVLQLSSAATPTAHPRLPRFASFPLCFTENTGTLRAGTDLSCLLLDLVLKIGVNNHLYELMECYS